MRTSLLCLSLLCLGLLGCRRAEERTATPVPQGPAVTSTVAAKGIEQKAKPTAEDFAECCADPSLMPVSTPGSAPEVTLKTVKLEALKEIIAAERGKIVLVDVWADYCVPCKKEFPHLVALHKKYADQGLVCLSVCVDSPKSLSQPLNFLKKQEATLRNYWLDDEANEWQDHWNVNAIPAVFVYRDGQEIARFTMDDPDHQFTYADVEKKLTPLMAKHLKK